jgi:acetyl-CoA C-acetyltransferase
MANRVAIVGTFQSSYERAKRGQHITELVYETVSGLLNNLGMDISEVDNVVSCSQDFLDGRTISNRTIPEAEGAFLKSESKVAGDGAQAVFYGMIRILSGKYRTCLVLAHAKMSEGSQNVIANAMFDPIYQRGLGLDEIIAAALQARAYMSKYHVSPEQTAEAAAKSLTQAAKNKNVFRGRKITAKQVLASKMLSSPIRELEAFVPADGACALMLVSEDQAFKWTKNPVWVIGAGTAMEEYYLGDRDLASARALKESAKRAYKMAGVRRPEKEIDLVELSNYFSYQELMYPEALGLCAPGKGAALLASGKTLADGKLPVNPSGGVLGGNPLCVSGLARVIEAANQIRGEAGKVQVKKPVNIALAQGSYGPAGQSQCLLVLSADAGAKAKVKSPARKKGKK